MRRRVLQARSCGVGRVRSASACVANLAGELGRARGVTPLPLRSFRFRRSATLPFAQVLRCRCRQRHA
jgi:hypothetical protein